MGPKAIRAYCALSETAVETVYRIPAHCSRIEVLGITIRDRTEE
jgi:hypothetical protein